MMIPNDSIIYHSMVNSKYIDILKLLIGASPHFIDGLENGNTFLTWFCSNRKEHQLLHLDQKGFKKDHQNKDGDTALHLVIKNVNCEPSMMIAVLLLCGADPNFRNKKDQYPLHLAVELGDDNLIKILLAYGAKPYLDSVKSSSISDPGHIYQENINSGRTLSLLRNIGTIISQFENYHISIRTQTFVLLESLFGESIKALKSESFYNCINQLFLPNMDRFNSLKLGLEAPTLFSCQKLEKFNVDDSKLKSPDAIATTKSDIHSLGVVLFELCASIPYIGHKYIIPFGYSIKWFSIAYDVKNYLRPTLHPSIPQSQKFNIFNVKPL
ncbi:hypothetical protein RB653_010032 [Dictyostelium firmibasis]|uniref:Ankyrin repeat-containing protein n=1 Tax=Dictyostelium firmibasis TaxID=79012 RepID=A0AAN7TK82_9MYCE